MRSKLSLREGSRGFTLLEVLLIIVILITVLFPLLQMLSSGLLVSDKVKGTNTAMRLAQEQMESIKNSAFADISSEPQTVIASYPAYSSQVVVSAPQTNLKDVQVIVYWNPMTGSQTSVSVETYISNF
jgi:type II secretory pathway pseudopilin PulG